MTDKLRSYGAAKSEIARLCVVRRRQLAFRSPARQGLPNQLTDAVPYVATLAALAISHRRRLTGVFVETIGTQS